MLANLLNTPKTEQEWLWFVRDHRDSHDRIRAAIKTQYGVDLTDYTIEPVNFQDTRQFLQYNSSLHSDMNAIVKSQSSDLLDVDFKNPEQVQAWFNLHYQEHENAEQLLKIGG